MSIDHSEAVLAAIYAAYHSKTISELKADRDALEDELASAVRLAQKMIDIVIAQKQAMN